MRSSLGLVLLCAVALSVRSAHAVSISITNPGFETNVLAAGAGTSTAPTGWSSGASIAANGIAYHPTATELPSGAPEGQNIVGVFGAGSLFPFSLFQNVGTVSAGTYLLTYDVGNLVGYSTAGYQVLLQAKGASTTALGTDNNSLSPLAGGQFKPGSISVTVGAGSPLIGQTLAIKLVSLGGSLSSPTNAFFDDFKLQLTPVPEPGTFALAGCGLALFGAVVIRKRAKAKGRATST